MKKLTIKGAAEFYGKSESWIRKKILSGELKASKEPFKYGKRWITTKQALDELEEQLNEQAKVQNDVVQVREVENLINADQLVERIQQQYQNSVDQAAGEIKEVINEQNKKIDQQQELIKKLSDQVEEMQQRQNKTLFDKIKGFFNK